MSDYQNLDETPGSISEGQLDFITDLIDARDLLASPKFFDAVNAMDAEEFEAYLNNMKQEVANLSKADASKWIDRLKKLPYKGQRERQANYDNRSNGGPEPEAGMYRREDGKILRVYLGQKSGRMLMKMLVENWEPGAVEAHGGASHRYEYQGAASGRMHGLVPLSLEEAKEFGRMTGTCCVCARRLDVPESVEAGIGPVCAGRMEDR